MKQTIRFLTLNLIIIVFIVYLKWVNNINISLYKYINDDNEIISLFENLIIKSEKHLVTNINIEEEIETIYLDINKNKIVINFYNKTNTNLYKIEMDNGSNNYENLFTTGYI